MFIVVFIFIFVFVFNPAHGHLIWSESKCACYFWPKIAHSKSYIYKLVHRVLNIHTYIYIYIYICIDTSTFSNWKTAATWQQVSARKYRFIKLFHTAGGGIQIYKTTCILHISLWNLYTYIHMYNHIHIRVYGGGM